MVNKLTGLHVINNTLTC